MVRGFLFKSIPHQHNLWLQMDFAYAFSLFYYTFLAAKINNYFIPAKLFIKKVIIINMIIP